MKTIQFSEDVNDNLSDDEAKYYNERIRHFENRDYSGTRKVDLSAIKKR